MQVRPLVTGVLLLGFLASCGQCGATTTPAGGQHLVFTGPIAGTLTDAKTLCTDYKSQDEADFTLTGTLGGQDLTFDIHIHANYGGPGTYQVGSPLDGAAEIRLQAGTSNASSTTGAGIVTILGDARSGTVTANLSGGEHVEGRFSCDKVTVA